MSIKSIHTESGKSRIYYCECDFCIARANPDWDIKDAVKNALAQGFEKFEVSGIMRDAEIHEAFLCERCVKTMTRILLDKSVAKQQGPYR